MVNASCCVLYGLDDVIDFVCKAGIRCGGRCCDRMLDGSLGGCVAAKDDPILEKKIVKDIGNLGSICNCLGFIPNRFDHMFCGIWLDDLANSLPLIAGIDSSVEVCCVVPSF